MTRQANHLAITETGKVHAAADSKMRPYHILACNGRALEAAGIGFSADYTVDAVTCGACLKGIETGSIEIVGQS